MPRTYPDSAKAAAGFGLLIILLLCALIFAGFGAHAARTGANEMKNRRLPLMETALALEGLVYEAVLHAGMFGSSGDMASYSGARIRFAAIRDTAAYLVEQAADIPEGREIIRDLDTLRGLVRRLDLVVEKKRTLNDALAAERVRLRRCADAMGDILLDLQARAASVATTGDSGKDRDGKAWILALNGFALAVEGVTGRVIASGVSKSAGDLAGAETYFRERWRESRDACGAAARLPIPGGIPGATQPLADPAGEMERLAAAFREIMGLMRFNVEEAARITEDRTEISERLTGLTRGIAAGMRVNMERAADAADAALAGATAAIFAGALLACVLAAGVAVFFARSRRAS